MGFSAMARKVTGTVSDSFGTIPGICVVIKGTTIGTITNLDGNYAIECGSNDVLVFSGLGYTTQEIRVGAKNSINVTMEFDNPSIVFPNNRHNLTALLTSMRGEAFLDDKILCCIA